MLGSTEAQLRKAQKSLQKEKVSEQAGNKQSLIQSQM